jgi:hypothetical protein
MPSKGSLPADTSNYDRSNFASPSAGSNISFPRSDGWSPSWLARSLPIAHKLRPPAAFKRSLLASCHRSFVQGFRLVIPRAARFGPRNLLFVRVESKAQTDCSLYSE